MKAYPTQLPGYSLKNVQNVIAIGSGKGGVGKSTVTVNLAYALTTLGISVGVLDADLYGASIPIMLSQKETQSTEDDSTPKYVHGIYAMSIGYFIQSQQPLIWRGPMLAKSLLQLFNITNWPKLDILLVDLPPGTGDIALSLVQKIPLSAAIVVTTPQDAATAQAQKSLEMFQKARVKIAGVVENMSFHICTHCHHHETLFGEGGGEKLASHYNVPLLGQLPLSQAICEHGDLGLPIAKDKTHPATQYFHNIAKNLVQSF